MRYRGLHCLPFIHPSIHPSIHPITSTYPNSCCVGSSLSKGPVPPNPSHLLQLRWENSEVFPGQPTDIISLMGPGSDPGPPHGRTWVEYLLREMSKDILTRCPNHLNVQEQWLYAGSFPDGWTSHPISKGESGQPAEKSHFSRLYLQSHSFGHYSQFMTIDRQKVLPFGPTLSSFVLKILLKLHTGPLGFFFFF